MLDEQIKTGMYLLLDPDHPDSQAQQEFIKQYILQRFGQPDKWDPIEWGNAQSEAIAAYWSAQGFDRDPEDDAFILPKID